MKKSNLILHLAWIILILNTCKKEKDTARPGNDDGIPTELGTETGIPNVKIIGTEGGTINSMDGRLELIIPAGALSASMPIVIQPVTNHAPGGTGDAYRFLPEGTQLSSPVTLKFHYTDKDIQGSHPLLMGIAFQDTNNVWYDLRKYFVDTLEKTIGITTANLFGRTSKSTGKRTGRIFMDHATFMDLYIVPGDAQLKAKESKHFQVFAIENHESNDPGNDNEDYLPPLPIQHEVSPAVVKQWSANGVVNGDAQSGIINPDGAACTYKAPDTKPPSSKNPVQLTADIKLWYRDPVTGRDFNNLKLTAPIIITDDIYTFQLKLEFKWSNFTQAVFNWTLEDLATIDVKIENDQVTISNIQNKNGTVTPTTQSTPYGEGTCTATLKTDTDTTGYYNVSNVTGNVYPNSEDQSQKLLVIKVVNSKTTMPKIHVVCTGTGEADHGGGVFNDSEKTYEFLLKAANQVANPGDPIETVTLTYNE